jgi:hypothetical protein
MQERAKPEASSPRRQREDYDVQKTTKTRTDQPRTGKKPSRAESGILRELVEEQRHLD